MINTGIIGKGKWGNKLKKILDKISKVKFFIDSKISFKKIISEVDWVFVATPNKTHYSIVFECLKRKKNIFCEKPLTLSAKKSKYLFNYANKNNLKLYVYDIENFKLKKIKINPNKNTVIRKKNGIGNNKSLLYRLTYHNFYLLYDKLKKYKIKKIINHSDKEKLSFSIVYKNFYINFIYSINSKKNIHVINDVNFLKFRGDPLAKMLNKVLANKVNYLKNQKSALFANYLIDKIKYKIN